MNWSHDAADLPAEKGAYVLLITLTRAAALPKRFGARVLAPGRYLYFGSAKGPGGIRARVTRHMKKDKALQWHVDYATTGAAAVTARAHVGGDECALREETQKRLGLKAPVPGLGSSDCRTCPSHLLALPKGVAA